MLVLEKHGICLVACVGAELAMLRALLLIATPKTKEVHFSPLCVLIKLPTYALFYTKCQPLHLFLQQLHFIGVMNTMWETWQHLLCLGQCERLQTSFFHECF